MSLTSVWVRPIRHYTREETAQRITECFKAIHLNLTGIVALRKLGYKSSEIRKAKMRAHSHFGIVWKRGKPRRK